MSRPHTQFFKEVFISDDDRSLAPVEEAALFVQLARNGQRIGGIKTTKRATTCFRFRHKRPTWTFHEEEWEDGAAFPQSGMPYIPYAVCMGITGVCLTVVGVAAYLESQFEGTSLRQRMLMLLVFALVLQSAWLSVTVVRLILGLPPAVSFSPVEILFPALIEPFYVHNILYLSLTIAPFLGLMVMLGIFICIYTGLGFLVFAPQSGETQDIFNTFGNALWMMLMTLNASDWPDPIIPAYTESRLYFIYFFVYIIIVDWGMLNLLLGFVYAFFRLNQVGMLRQFKAVRRKNLEKAFRILDDKGKGYITYPVVDDLLRELYLHYSTLATLPTDRERFALARNLDPNGDGRILMEDFLHLERQCFGDAVESIRSTLFCEKVAKLSARSPRSPRSEWHTEGSQSHDSFYHSRGSPGGSIRSSMRSSMRGSVQDHDRQSETFDSFDNADRQPLLHPLPGENKSTDGDMIHFVTGLTFSSQDISDRRQDSVYVQSHATNPMITGVAKNNASKVPKLPLPPPLPLPPSLPIESRHASTSSHGSHLYPQDHLIPAVEPYRKGTFQDLLAMRCPRSFEDLQHNIVLVVDSDVFCIFVDCVFLILGVLYEATSNAKVLLATVVVCCLESALRLAIKGWYRIKKSYRNSYDIFVAFLLLLSGLALKISHLLYPDKGDDDITVHIPLTLTQGVVLLRLVSFPRIIVFLGFFKTSDHNMRHALRYVMRSAGDFTFLLLALFGLLYCFASIGLQCFGGMIRKTGDGSEEIYNSDYGKNGYWPLNFNDISSGIATTFVLLSVNNMHVICSGFTAAAGTYWPRLYFACFWLFGPLLLLNVVTSFFLNELMSWQSHRVQQASLDAEQSELTTDGAPLPLGQDDVDNSRNRSSSNLIQSLVSSSVQTREPSAVGIKTDMIDRIDPKGNPAFSANASVCVSVVSTPRDSREEPSFHDAAKWLGSKSMGAEREGLVDRGRDMHPDEDVPYGTDDDGIRRERVFSASLFADADMRRMLATELLAKRSVMRKRFLSNVSAASMMSDAGGSRQVSVQFSPRDGILDDADFGHARNYRESLERNDRVESRSFFYSLFSSRRATINTEESLRTALLDTSTHGEDDMEKKDLEADVVPLSKLSGSGGWRSILQERLPSSVHFGSGDAKGAARTKGNVDTKVSTIKGYEAAAMLIQCARDGVDHDIHLTRNVLNLWRLRQKMKYPLRLGSWLLMGIIVFEKPFWSYDKDNWDALYYPSSGVCKLSPVQAAYIKLPLVCLLLTGLILETGYKQNLPALCKLRPMTIFRLTLLMLSAFQLVMLLYLVISEKTNRLTAHIPVFCILYVFWYDSRTLQRMGVIMSIFPKLLALCLLFIMLILAFASFGPLWSNINYETNDDDFNRSQFSTIINSLWSVFAAITSSSYPQQVLPLYRSYRVFFIYFFAFITLGAFGMLNLIFVLVLLMYNKATQRQADVMKINRHMLLLRAFETLDVEQRGWLDYREMLELLDELYTYYYDFRKGGIPDRRMRKLMIKVMDVDGDGWVTFSDFVFLIDVTRLKLSSVVHETPLQAMCPTCAYSTCFRRFSSFIKSKYFDFLMDILLFLLMLAQSFEDRETDSNAVKRYRYILILTYGVFMLETGIKIIIMGWRGYIRKVWNRWDLVFDVVYLVALIQSFTMDRSDTAAYIASGSGAVLSRLVQSTRFTLHVALRNSSHMIPRLVNTGTQISSGMNVTFSLTAVVSKIARSIYTLMITFICIAFAYSFFGVLLFGGSVNTNPQSHSYQVLIQTQYGQDNFWHLNFNDFLSAFVTLMCALHVSDFDVLATAFAALTDEWAKLYFVAWYVIGVLLLLNVVKSFFLSEFLVFALGNSQSKSAEEKDAKEKDSFAHQKSTEELQPPLQDKPEASGSGRRESTGNFGGKLASSILASESGDHVLEALTSPEGYAGNMSAQISSKEDGSAGAGGKVDIRDEHGGEVAHSQMHSASTAAPTSSPAPPRRRASSQYLSAGPKAKRTYVVGIKAKSNSFNEQDEVDSEEHTVRAAMRFSDAEEGDLSDGMHHERAFKRGAARRMSVFTANTDKVKDLEPHELEQLHLRLNQLALSLSNDLAEMEGLPAMVSQRSADAMSDDFEVMSGLMRGSHRTTVHQPHDDVPVRDMLHNKQPFAAVDPVAASAGGLEGC